MIDIDYGGYLVRYAIYRDYIFLLFKMWMKYTPKYHKFMPTKQNCLLLESARHMYKISQIIVPRTVRHRS